MHKAQSGNVLMVGHSGMTKYQIEDGARHSRRVSRAGTGTQELTTVSAGLKCYISCQAYIP
eukprot:COSAG02_NODE_55_length_43887_cov_30.660364_32_plen_61_part_00